MNVLRLVQTVLYCDLFSWNVEVEVTGEIIN